MREQSYMDVFEKLKFASERLAAATKDLYTARAENARAKQSMEKLQADNERLRNAFRCATRIITDKQQRLDAIHAVLVPRKATLSPDVQTAVTIIECASAPELTCENCDAPLPPVKPNETRAWCHYCENWTRLATEEEQHPHRGGEGNG